jgi:hypothetical protein
MAMNDVPRCQHVKMNGTQCGSPALRRKRHCYFHHRMRDGKRSYVQNRARPRPIYSMCLLEDANSVQVALMQVLELLACGQMEPKVAGLMLYGLQIASTNLKHTSFEALASTHVVIDRDDVHRTCIDGPQWFESDFGTEARQQQPRPLEEEEEEDDQAPENEKESATEEESAAGDLIAEGSVADDSTADDPTEDDSAEDGLNKDDWNEDDLNENQEGADVVQAAGVSSMKVPVESHVTIEEARKRVQGMIRNFLLDMVPEKSAASPG